MSGKRGTCQNKKGTYQRWKGEGALLKINRATYQSNRGTFYVKRGASYKVKGALFAWKKGHFWGTYKVGGHCAPPPCPPGPPPLLTPVVRSKSLLVVFLSWQRLFHSLAIADKHITSARTFHHKQAAPRAAAWSYLPILLASRTFIKSRITRQNIIEEARFHDLVQV